MIINWTPSGYRLFNHLLLLPDLRLLTKQKKQSQNNSCSEGVQLVRLHEVRIALDDGEDDDPSPGEIQFSVDTSVLSRNKVLLILLSVCFLHSGFSHSQ